MEHLHKVNDSKFDTPSLQSYTILQLRTAVHLYSSAPTVIWRYKDYWLQKKKKQKDAECIIFQRQTKQFLIIRRTYVTKYEHLWCHEMIFPEHGDSILSDTLVPTCPTATRYNNPQQSSGLRLKLKTDVTKSRRKTFLYKFYAGIRSQIINRLLVCWNYIEKLISERKYWHINFISCSSWLLFILHARY